MVTELRLTGNELLAFALVHQFTQGFAGEYLGNTAYLSEWTGWTENTARKHLAALVKKGLIEERRGRQNNTPFCHYVLAGDFYKKHPSIFEGSPLKKEVAHPANFAKSTPKNLRGENNNIGNKGDNNTPLIPPTLAEVTAYAHQQGAKDPEGFADYYLRCQKEMQWRTKFGKPVENWKLNVIQWLKYHKNETFPRPANTKHQQINDLKAFLQ